MGEATNSSSGRATRLPASSRSRGLTLYDRLEEARLRRQVVLAAKKAALPSNSAAEPAITRNHSGVVEPVAEGAEISESAPAEKELSPEPQVDLQDDADVREVARDVVISEAVQTPWRLVGPGVLGGFVFAMSVIILSEVQVASVTSRIVAIDPASSQAASLQIPIALLSAPVMPEIGATFGPADGPNGPALRQLPGAAKSTDILQPAPVVISALDSLPAALSSPPEPALAAPLVLNRLPPVRPSIIKAAAARKPAFPGLAIVLHIPNGARASDADTLLDAAVGAGFEISTLQPAGFTISRTNIRYFHDKDAQAARALALAIGGRLRDFTGFRPPPDPGVIEIWLAGTGTEQRAGRVTSGSDGSSGDLDRLLGNLLRALGTSGG